jgi:hypothetical protein
MSFPSTSNSKNTLRLIWQAAPDYELASFRDSIPSQTPLLNHLAIAPNDNAIVAHSTTNPNWRIWPTIIAALIVLAFSTYKLAGDIKKTKG